MAPRTPATLQQPLPLPRPEIPRDPLYAVWPVRIESNESLGLVVAEIARLDALVERVKADAKDDVAAAQRRALERLNVEIEGRKDGPLTVADWRAALLAGAEKYCTKHRAELLEDGRKSFDVAHGRVGWRDGTESLEPLPDFDEHGNDKILKALLAGLRKALQDLADFADGAARFVDVKVAWRKKELLAAFIDQDLSAALLRKTGFTVPEPVEEFYVKPQTNDVASQSAERPKSPAA